jgi:hypothetical protein
MGRTQMSKKMMWTPPTNLNAPIPPMDYVYRWVRLAAIKSKSKRKKLGISFVRLIELKSKKRYPFIHIKYLGKCVGVGGVALIKIKRIN